MCIVKGYERQHDISHSTDLLNNAVEPVQEYLLPPRVQPGRRIKQPLYVLHQPERTVQRYGACIISMYVCMEISTATRMRGHADTYMS